MFDVKSGPPNSTFATGKCAIDKDSATIHAFGNAVASSSTKLDGLNPVYIWFSQKITSLLDSRKTRCVPAGEHQRGTSMVYIQRDNQGYLLRVEMDPFEGMTDSMAIESEELQNWLRTQEEMKARLTRLYSSDLELVRVLEDVVSLLVEQGVINYTDLPKAAREKLDQRAVARADIEGLNDALADKQ